MNTSDFVAEFIKSLAWASATALVSGFVGLVGVSFWMWIDVRSLKKSMNAAWNAIREVREDK